MQAGNIFFCVATVEHRCKYNLHMIVLNLSGWGHAWSVASPWCTSRWSPLSCRRTCGCLKGTCVVCVCVVWCGVVCCVVLCCVVLCCVVLCFVLCCVLCCVVLCCVVVFCVVFCVVLCFVLCCVVLCVCVCVFHPLCSTFSMQKDEKPEKPEKPPPDLAGQQARVRKEVKEA